MRPLLPVHPSARVESLLRIHRNNFEGKAAKRPGERARDHIDRVNRTPKPNEALWLPTAYTPPSLNIYSNFFELVDMFTYSREFCFLVFLVHDRRRDVVIDAPSTRFFVLRFSVLRCCKRRQILRLNCISRYGARRLHVNGRWSRRPPCSGLLNLPLAMVELQLYRSLAGTNPRDRQRQKLTCPWPRSGTGAISSIEPSPSTIWDRVRRRWCAHKFVSWERPKSISRTPPILKTRRKLWCSREVNNLAKRCHIVHYKGIGMLVSIYTVTWYESFRDLVNVTLPKIGPDIAYSINEIKKR